MLYFATDYKAKDAELHSSRLIDAQKSLHVASQCSDNTFTSFFSRYPCAQFVKCHTIVSKPRSLSPDKPEQKWWKISSELSLRRVAQQLNISNAIM